MHFMYSCPAGTGFRCPSCPDFDVCAKCKESPTFSHPHELAVSVFGFFYTTPNIGYRLQSRGHLPSCHTMSPPRIASRCMRGSVKHTSLRVSASFVSCSSMQAHARAVYDETRDRLTEQQRFDRHAQLQKTLALLVHACTCLGNCNSASCHKVQVCDMRPCVINAVIETVHGHG